MFAPKPSGVPFVIFLVGLLARAKIIPGWRLDVQAKRRYPTRKLACSLLQRSGEILEEIVVVEGRRGKRGGGGARGDSCMKSGERTTKES